MKRIEIQKNDDGTFEELDGCTIEEFNKGGNLMIMNMGDLSDGELWFVAMLFDRRENAVSGKTIRMKTRVTPDVDFSLRGIEKTMRCLLGEDDYEYLLPYILGEKVFPSWEER